MIVKKKRVHKKNVRSRRTGKDRFTVENIRIKEECEEPSFGFF